MTQLERRIYTMTFSVPWLRSRPPTPEDAHTIRLEVEQAANKDFLMMSMSGTDIVARNAALGWWKFEQPLPAVFVACAIHWPGRIVDVGANTGFYSFLALCAHEANSVVGFEPDPKVLAILRKNIEINAVSRRITINPIALSDRVGEAKLYIPLQDHGLVESSSSLESGFKAEHSAEVSVPVDLLDNLTVDSPPITLIKVDVEGHEKNMIKGAEATLAKHRPILVVELLDTADFEYFTDLKNRLNYRSVRLRHEEAIVEEDMILDLAAWNHVLVPEEKWHSFRSILDVLLL